MNQGPSRTALVAPLDWGLGHSARCVPLIQRLIYKKYRVILAGNETQGRFLRPIFPQLTWLELPGYEVKYSSRLPLALCLAAQLPRLSNVIRAEHQWLETQLKSHQVDVVISDNRYGLWHPSVKTVFLSHQLQIRTPFFTNLVRRMHYRFIKRFSECWVPDAHQNGLAGSLSHPKVLPAIPVQYLGSLSRFSYKTSTPVTGKILALISGPEPQRSNLEQLVRDFFRHRQGENVLVRGLPGSSEAEGNGVFNHLSTDALSREIESAEYLICRSGYSTLMDLERFGKQMILVPTPGQTEQGYLAEHFEKKGWAIQSDQTAGALQRAFVRAGSFEFQTMPHTGNINWLDDAIDGLEKIPDPAS